MRLNAGILAAAIPLVCSVALAAPISIANANFGAVAVTCGLNYAYQSASGNCSSIGPQQNFNAAAGFGWTLAGGAGLTKAGSNFFPPSNFSDFTQALFLQSVGSSATQSVAGFLSGAYILTFRLGSRFPQSVCCDGKQTVQALIDGSVIGTWALSDSTLFTLTTASFSVASGTHTLQLLGTATGDHTAFISDVAIASAVPEPGGFALLSAGLIALGGFAGSRKRKFRRQL